MIFEHPRVAEVYRLFPTNLLCMYLQAAGLSRHRRVADTAANGQIRRSTPDAQVDARLAVANCIRTVQ